jgi:hypothetical protein
MHIHLRREKITHCNCGADFRHQSTLSGQLASSTMSRLFPEIDLTNTGKTFEREPDLHWAAARVCQWLSLKPDSNGKRPIRENGVNIRLSIDQLDGLQKLVVNWPSALAFSITPGVDLDSLSSCTALSKVLFRRRFSLYAIVTEKIRCNSEVLMTDRRSKSTSAYSLHHRSNIDALEQLTGYSSRLIRRQIAMGGLVPGLLKYGDLFDPDRIEIDAHAIELVSSFYAETLGLDYAAKMMGCSTRAMHDLIRMNLIASQSICIDPAQITLRRVYPEDLNEFSNGLFSLSHFTEDLTKIDVKFSEWNMKHWHAGGHSQSRWQDIFSAIRAGKLKLYRSVQVPWALDHLLLEAKELDLFSDKRRSRLKCS